MQKCMFPKPRKFTDGISLPKYIWKTTLQQNTHLCFINYAVSESFRPFLKPGELC